jgi:hypothetical protein
MTLESFVDVSTAAEFLAITNRRLLELTRAGKIPAHALDPNSQKKQWRYRLSELESFFLNPDPQAQTETGRTSAR